MNPVLKANVPGIESWPDGRLPGEVLDLAAPIRRSLGSVRFAAPDTRPLRRREALLLGALALALHAGALHWLGRHSAPPLPEVPVQVPPMTIEFSSPAPPAEPLEPTPPPPAVAAPEPPPPPPVVEELAPRKAPPKPPKPQPPRQKAEAKPARTPPAKAEAPPAPTAPPAPAAPASAPAQAPLTPPSAGAGYLKNPAPEYPALALRRNWEGSVLLRVHVLASGRPSEIRVQQSSGRDLLDEAAVAAVRRWSFVPAKRGDQAQDGWVTVPIDFKLN
ncbi:TonB protein [Azotobacter vinelandii CA]|uniref:TonB protein n=2 Tax=Azotobacter vinelandii TaxID=354 RepID=C1DMM3_AZOVD|nr:energy transducer TonB [Azotobacter vinelandii]ACO77053.1 TonB protein [Azotobacter vinelandii DJ]AGK14031.1 TonB protein [Azotobacter vinelandii CA]AGK18876.1 TonB protein [Azotobacter vinelandii CA6]GLK61044.1 protein tonB2 [Azotobacter vinelandii]